ncbi:UNVERIFIED_CONTAM: SprT family protein [Streptococcus canis]|uniref:Protein SprT-like n=1 Tax=Streptococcus canis FSL Z3-227 TaxID=482234 RepID=A0AAV3FQQ4_STRCB|nr:SprT family protein [Streptococcus canis]EIQ81435.1 hypothetical protein SCAZ3_03385 [Streptococcus canis FSL Z3-227]MDV5988293.1 SprT family protein [Streptococcus canis]MDV5993486.1 SprT family protein [Streptococcus canis]MDV6022843.1 SprT family protein [Streptococcus canis]VEE25795.1 SprT-like protein [Streptococcus canis]
MTLTKYVQKVSLADFGKPFTHKAYWNKRLKTTGGRFFPKDGHLDFNPRILEEQGEFIFRKIVRHELCHYHLYFAGKGYQHRDKDFKDLLAQVDGLRYVPMSSKPQVKYYYACQACGQIYSIKRRINLAKYVCGNCRGKLIEKNQS